MNSNYYIVFLPYQNALLAGRPGVITAALTLMRMTIVVLLMAAIVVLNCAVAINASLKFQTPGAPWLDTGP